MKHDHNRFTDHPLSFSRANEDEPAVPTAPDHKPSEADGVSLASNVLWGTNQDLTPKTACQGDTPETPAPAAAKPARQNRTCRIKIRFTPEEYADVKRKAKEAGTDCSKYVRAKVCAAELVPGPDVDTAAYVAAVRRVGHRLNAICAQANATGFIDAPELRDTLREVTTLMNEIKAAFADTERRGE